MNVHKLRLSSSYSLNSKGVRYDGELLFINSFQSHSYTQYVQVMGP